VPAAAAYKARGAALSIWRDRSPEVLLCGPAGTGKSRACLEKLHACLLRWPGSRAAIVRKTRESLTQSGLVTYEEKVLPEGSPIAAGPQRRNRQSYIYPGGSELVVAGLDKPKKIMSTEFDIIYVQEATDLLENDHESLTTRLRNGVMPFQQLLADCNPDAPTHWLKKRIDAGKTRCHDSRHEDNPVYWDAAKGDWTPQGRAYVLGVLDNLTGARYLRLRKGLWAAAEGLVYDEWDSALHLVEPFPIPPEWRRIRAIDFGYTNPFVCQWWAIDPDGRMFLYRELYGTGRLVSDWATKILALSAGESIEETIADHDAEDRATLDAAGIPTRAAHKAVKPGIEAVQRRLRRAGDGKPRLFVCKGATVEVDESLAEARKPTHTAAEIEGYVWSKGTDGRAAKEEPVKLNDHGMDTMRYAACYCDDLGVIRIEAI
jgi:phage terminase large subunit